MAKEKKKAKSLDNPKVITDPGKISDMILKEIKPLLNEKVNLFFKVGKTIFAYLDGLERGTQREVINLLKEKVDVYSKGYIWESFNLYVRRPELADRMGKLTLSHYRTLYRHNIPEEVRGMLEDQAKTGNWGVRELAEKIADYKEQKKAGFNDNTKEHMAAMRKEITLILKELTEEQLDKVRTYAGGFIKVTE